MKEKSILLFLVFVMLLFTAALFGETVQVSSIVEKNDLSVGESFIYQVQIKGSEKISSYPENSWGNSTFSKNFSVKFLGGQNNSSSRITIINGKRRESVNRGYFISYRLIPKTTGILTIPAITITVDGNNYTTKPIQVKVTQAEQSKDFHLKVELDKNKSYVGEQFRITFTWYIGLNVKDFTYSIPFFQNKNFYFSDPSNTAVDPSRLVSFPINGTTVNAVQGKGSFNGKTYTTLTFSKLVTPKKSGNFTIHKSVISVSAQTAGSSGSNDFFNSFFSSVSPEYSQFSVPSNSLSIEVLELPKLNKPNNFSGYIGELHIKTTASPLNVKTGDPITLTLKIWGPKNISVWDAPDLEKQAELSANFKIPSEISAGKIDEDSIIFTQTIRAKSNNVTEIPSIIIPYFDTITNKYSFAKSDPIPITVEYVESVKIEGLSTPTSQTLQNDKVSQKLLQTSRGGINFNYEDNSILKKQSYGINSLFHFPLLGFIILPALIFLSILLNILFHKYKLFSKKYYRKNTLGLLKKDLNKIKTDNLVTNKTGKKITLIFQKFLSRKIFKDSTLTSIEKINEWLNKNDGSDKNISLILEIFKNLDEIQFAGSILTEEDYKLKYTDIINKILTAAEILDRRIQK